MQGRAPANTLASLEPAATLLGPLLDLLEIQGEARMKTTRLAAAIVSFAAAPFWVRGEQPAGVLFLGRAGRGDLPFDGEPART